MLTPYRSKANNPYCSLCATVAASLAGRPLFVLFVTTLFHLNSSFLGAMRDVNCTIQTMSYIINMYKSLHLSDLTAQ